MRTTYGKTRITVTVEGCHGCGTKWNGGWGIAKEVLLQIGSQTGKLDLPLCAKCIGERVEQTKQNNEAVLTGTGEK